MTSVGIRPASREEAQMPKASVLSNQQAVSHYTAPPAFLCTWNVGGTNAAWVHAVGELDRASAPLLKLALGEDELRARLVVLDLRDVTFMDSSGIHVILDATAEARRAGGRLVHVRGPAHVDRALTLTGAATQVLIFDLDPNERPAETLRHLASLTDR
jgi:anti-anti-sigma factor